MQLSIIIVNYRVRYFLEQCLHSVVQAVAGLEAEIIVVDNDPAEGSIDYLQPKFASVRFIANAANTGFAKANNLALRHARGQYVLYLNPDTLVPLNCLHQCLQHMAAHPQAGALGICMVDGSGRYLPESKRAFPAPGTAFFKLFGLTALFPRSPVFARYYLGHLSHTQNQVVDVLAGAFMLAPRAVLQAAGGFSEAYFMYGEDIDLSYRIQQAGWQNHYFARCPIVHFKGESTKRGTLNYVRLFYGAMIIFVKQHYGGGRAKFFSGFIRLAIGVRAAVALVGQVGASLTGWWPKPAPHQPQALLLLGSGNATASAAALLKFANRPYTLMQGIQQAPVNSGVVFCFDAMANPTDPESLSLQQAIALMQQYKQRFLYHFHYAGSGNIINSHSKAANGEPLQLPV